MPNFAATHDGHILGHQAKVLIVDDSVVARGLFSRWVEANPRLCVAGVAADGVSAVRLAGKVQPDIVILDLDMPVMDGLTALPEILKASPASSVVIASSLTARSARLSLQCLALGAVDIQPKPDSNRDLTMSVAFREELMRKLDGLISANPASQRHPRAGLAAASAMPAHPQAPPAPHGSETHRSEAIRPDGWRGRDPGAVSLRLEVMPRILLIGASTGGPRAVTRLLDDLGAAAARLPIIIAQHMPAIFTASFAEQLQGRLGRPAREAIHGETPLAGHIYVAPGGRHLRLEKGEPQPRLIVDDSAPVRFCRPSIDMIFSDASAVYGASALGVILTGMGTDGLDGARRLRLAGARIIAQDEGSSVVWGMPGAVAREGVAHCVLPITAIGGVIASAFNMGARA